MRISTKGRYALRMMIEIGLHPDRCTKISEVAARQQISDKYLEQIVTLLIRAGYVKSVRGAQGGYLLTMPPEDYTVGMILRQTEGSISPVVCLDDDAAPCDRADGCVTLGVWKQLQDAINGVVDNVTLADLIAEQQSRPNETLM